MPTPLPVYPSFSLVVTQAILTVKPPPQKKTGLALPSKLPASTRYHPYTRPAKDSFDDDLLMTTVDYRFSPPPQRLPSPNPAVSYHPTVHVSLAPPPDSMLVETSDEEIETDATDVSDASDASDASHGSYNAAVDTLEAVVRVNRDRNIIRRRPSLTALVVDLALHLKEKCRRLAASGSGSRK